MIHVKAYGSDHVYERKALNLFKLPWFKQALLCCDGKRWPTGAGSYEKFYKGGCKYDWRDGGEFFEWKDNLFRTGALPPVAWKAFLEKYLHIKVPKKTKLGEKIGLDDPFDIYHWMSDTDDRAESEYRKGVEELFYQMLRERDLLAVSDEEKATHRLKCLGAYDLEIEDPATYYDSD